jgi:outer membrane protein assembly factor BamB
MGKTAPAALFAILVALSPPASSADWSDWRGPERDGRSPERGLPERWSPGGENLAWKVPMGGRSTPIVLADRVYLQTAVGEGATRQERVVCLDANTGRVLWEHRFNVYSSDVPPHRVGWASPVGDPVTGHVYAFGVGGTLLALDAEGRLLWERSLAEDFGLITTHGGRTVSPVLEGDTVIVSGLSSGWGAHARGAHRFFAFDKRTGETVWLSAPGGRPFDTTYSPPITTIVDGMRLLIAGGSDGAAHAMKALTGETVWSYPISKRGLNTGVVIHGGNAIVTHSEENLDGNEMGLMAAVDLRARGAVGKDQVRWAVTGFLGGFASPVVDGDRFYHVDNGANLAAFDAVTGKRLWMHNLGTIQKASPVLADGKLYVGSENGRFFILRPGPKSVEVLDEDALGPESAPEAIMASAAVSRGRIFLVSETATYCIGPKSPAHTRGASAKPTEAPKAGPVAHVQVVPAELTLVPGTATRVRARSFDAQGRLVGEEPAPTWAVEKLRGTVAADGTFTPAADSAGDAGTVTASLGGVTGAAHVRVVAPLPWSFDFQSMKVVPPTWISATGKYAAREIEGNGVLVKLADNPFTKRGRIYMGRSDWSDYTVEVDVLSKEQRRQMGDGGVVAQRYSLVLFGNHQRLELQSWQPETVRTATLPFPWKPDTWYRLKLRVANQADGTTRVQGKAWAAAGPEPDAWLVDRIEKSPNRQGSPGLYADAGVEVFFDNLKVTPNP